MSSMYNLFNSSRSSLLGRSDPSSAQRRNSNERHSLKPWEAEQEDEETSSKRYYRSADFRKALLEDHIQQSLTPPAPEPASGAGRRKSRHGLYRRSTTLSKSSLSSIIGLQNEPKSQEQPVEQTSEDEAHSPVSDDLNNTPAPETKDSTESTEQKTTEPERRFHLPKIHLDRVSPFGHFSRAQRKDE